MLKAAVAAAGLEADLTRRQGASLVTSQPQVSFKAGRRKNDPMVSLTENKRGQTDVCVLSQHALIEQRVGEIKHSQNEDVSPTVEEHAE